MVPASTASAASAASPASAASAANAAFATTASASATSPAPATSSAHVTTPSEHVSTSELVAETLVRLGVGHVFGVVGSGNFSLVGALRMRGVPYTAARHEGGAATMADAYARMSGRLGVVTTHQGCGYTNALTGIAEAAKSRTPMLVLTAAAPPAAPFNNFQMDQDAAARAVGAVAERVHGASTAVADVTRAWRAAVEGRRTVVLSVPIDVLDETAPLPMARATGAAASATIPSTAPNSTARAGARAPLADVEALAETLARAQRPVFIGGRGAREAGPQLAELAERTGALLATSAVAKGLFAGPAALGISGGFSSPTTARLIADADVIVSWGCALNDWTTRRGTLLAGATTLVQVDVEPGAIGAHRPVDLGVVGDSAAVAAEVAPLVAPREGYRTPDVLARIRDEADWRTVPFDDLGDDRRVDPRAVTLALDDALPAERIVSVDSGNFMGYPSQYLGVPDANGFCFTQAFQSIGLGLATAIGAATARPDRAPVLGTGDGGFHMAIAELETAVRLGLPLVVLVYNDASYSAEVHHFGAAATPGGASDFESVVFPDTDLAQIARGFGARGITVRSNADLDAMREAVRETSAMGAGQGVPLVIDAKIASDGGAWWLAEAFSAHT